jgi:AsmA-like protein
LGSEEVWFDKFSFDASGASVLIRSADLRWQNQRLSVAGKVDAEKEALRLDLDVSTDRLELAQLDRFFGGGGEQRDKTVRGVPAFPRLEGTIRLEVDEFATDQFTLSGVQVRTVLASSLITAAIERGVVCGINTTGRLEVAGREIRLDLQLAAKDAELEPTTICLTNQRSDIKGTYTLSARITARGDREHLGSALRGDFDLSARDGEFVRAGGVDATFDYLNDSGDFKVNFPDLDKQAVAYQLLTVIGKIDGARVFNDEIIIRASPYAIIGQGTLDLQRQQVDLKGLVSVALPAQQVIKRIPIIGSILGGSLVGIPLRISGSWERPNITYLSPADVGEELLNLPLRILGAPLDAFRLFAPGKEN